MNTVLLVVGLIALALFLVVVELIIVPGFGFAGVLALGVFGVAIWMAYAQLGVQVALAAIGAGVALSALLLWLLPKTRAAKRMVLNAAHHGAAPDSTLKQLEGQRGVALTPLRPSGTVRIDGKPVDVVTDGEYVEQGTPVAVVRVEGVRVVVQPQGLPATAPEKGES